MQINKAVITAAGLAQRTLPLQILIDSDGNEKSVLQIIVEEVLRGGIEEICVVVRPGDEVAYAKVAGDHAGRLFFVHQDQPRGYGHAVFCAKDFIGNDPFLHLVGDHLYISRSTKGCAQHLIEVAKAESCAVSAVQATRENLLPYFGTIGGQRIPGRKDLYKIEKVFEKPTPTNAEQYLIVSGLRAGYYLCFFGMHILTPTIIDILSHKLESERQTSVTLSSALNELAKQEQYLALEKSDLRYDVGVKYGLLTAQLALTLNGKDRDEVLTKLLTLLTHRELAISEEEK
jgi:UTP--glucose-1-phosphate uridylyltransferase